MLISQVSGATGSATQVTFRRPKVPSIPGQISLGMRVHSGRAWKVGINSLVMFSFADATQGSVFYIFAYGRDRPTSSDAVSATFQIHTFKEAPSSPVALLSAGAFSDQGSNSDTMILAHGALMVAAWSVLLPFA
jgi:hypothetical protein